MGKLSLLTIALLFAGAAQAGTYSIKQESDCPLVSAGELQSAIARVGKANGLDLPNDMALRAELRCTSEGKGTRARFVYTFRAAIEKQLADGEMQRWATVAQLTGYGTTGSAKPLLRDVSFTVRDLIRQEP
ncbi:hypothetical protein HHL11_19825 [Ramlibacter sp. G-1-2-2]|uniref:DUF3718 domain-containing protein n=1 Tax=Ramlibacter agri TaxID=2728837 RepID=A0A848H681_9BURK|nr:hypothetical protein [Ramlibacter agri]NML46007.1 hypothetical protein [Ramlibacter agri]